MRKAFTLIELLVVISIVALLIAILLPALNRARESANIISCASQSRQLALAVFLYSEDNKGAFPNSGTGSTVAGYGGTLGNLTSNLSHAVNQWGANRRLTNPYIGVPTSAEPDQEIPVHECPTDLGVPDADPDQTSYDLLGSSYFYNYYAPVRDPGKIFTLSTMKYDDVHETTKVLLIGDAPVFNYFQGVANERNQRWHDPTKPTANITFVDQHVEYLPIEPGNETENYTWLPWKQSTP